MLTRPSLKENVFRKKGVGFRSLQFFDLENCLSG